MEIGFAQSFSIGLTHGHHFRPLLQLVTQNVITDDIARDKIPTRVFENAHVVELTFGKELKMALV